MVFSARLDSVEDEEGVFVDSSLRDEAVHSSPDAREQTGERSHEKSSPDIPQAELQDIYNFYSKRVHRLAQRAQRVEFSLSGKREILRFLAVSVAEHHGAHPKRLAEVLEDACVTGATIGAAVMNGALDDAISAFFHNQKTGGDRLDALLRVAESETLFHAGLSSGLSGESLIHLTSFRSSSLAKILPLSRDEKYLQELLQVTTRSGYEEAVFGKLLTPSSIQLVRFAGIYGASIASYLSAVVAVVEGAGGSELRSWLPGGKDFQEIERQRLRWGQCAFQYDTYSQVAPEVFDAVKTYYQDQRGLSCSEAIACASDFLRGIFPEEIVIA